MFYRLLLLVGLLVFASCNHESKLAQEPLIQSVGKAPYSGRKLLIYVGSASRLPMEELIDNFREETGVEVDAIFGGSGYILAQMKLAQKGDIYFPGSSDYMEKAKHQSLVYTDTEKTVAYLVNTINVQSGNPKNIRELKDLCKPDISIAIGNPRGVCLGAYAVEIVEKSLSKMEVLQFKANIKNYAESCDKTASSVALQTVDAIIGWNVFEHWNPQNTETIKLHPDEIVRIGYIPIAISSFTTDKRLAQYFIDYISGEAGKTVFRKHHYLTEVDQAIGYAGDIKPVGGEYEVPPTWLE